jgi:hypothetical protein
MTWSEIPNWAVLYSGRSFVIFLCILVSPPKEKRRCAILMSREMLINSVETPLIALTLGMLLTRNHDPRYIGRKCNAYSGIRDIADAYHDALPRMDERSDGGSSTLTVIQVRSHMLYSIVGDLLHRKALMINTKLHPQSSPIPWSRVEHLIYPIRLHPVQYPPVLFDMRLLAKGAVGSIYLTQSGYILKMANVDQVRRLAKEAMIYKAITSRHQLDIVPVFYGLFKSAYTIVLVISYEGPSLHNFLSLPGPDRSVIALCV